MNGPDSFFNKEGVNVRSPRFPAVPTTRIAVTESEEGVVSAVYV
jgi:hypothetical protein